MSSVAAFDRLAQDYDATFSRTTLGRLLRRAVWRWLDAAFQPGDRVLELGCGTAEDAIHLAERGVHVLATDASPEMLALAREKVEGAGLGGLVALRTLDVERVVAEPLPGAPPEGWDGAFSSFGALNCVTDLRAVARGLAERLRPGAAVVLCIMGPLVPWEWGWFLAQGQLGKAFRRFRPGGATWRGLTVRYPSIRAARRAFDCWFRERRIRALGALLPPPYAESWARRHPRWLERLDRWERRLETWPLFPWLADHYLIELERR